MRPLLLTICWLTSVVVAQDKYTDENRPYKFGFNIEGHQHRKEEKDEKGIIKGEYGFITADGYYRVTIYETDENDDFKIVSQKNYYVGFPPGDPTTTEVPTLLKSPKKILLPLAKADEVSATQAPKVNEDTTRHPGRGGTCSGCFLPTTTKKPVEPQNVKSPNPLNNAPPNQNVQFPIQAPKNSLVNNQPSLLIRKLKNDTSQITVQPKLTQNELTTPLLSKAKTITQVPRNGLPLKSQNDDEINKNKFLIPLKNQNKVEINKNKLITPIKSSVINPATSGTLPLKNSGEDIPTNNGEIQPKISRDEMMALLYRFNYTVGFHGHHEDGYRNGDKAGDYFVNGRDGVSRKVTYIANEFGYQPNITLEQLNENNENYPKEKSEKEYGLKGYEFKWFYRR